MPLLHAEDESLQHQSVAMYKELLAETSNSSPQIRQIFERFQKISLVHYNSVILFGRFPERNAILRRKTTEEEKIYLKNTQVMRDEY